jgi:EAL domain-containing protein (putative c-di-GMP-specific phosphodiesterase class I)
MVTNFRHRAIVRTIAALAADLGLGLIAEGVETHDQAEVLRELGYLRAQGFLYSPALPLEELDRVLEHGVGGADSPKTGAVA